MQTTKESSGKELPANEMLEISVEEIANNLKGTLEVNVAKFFICYDKDDFLNGVSFAYFPCKTIEIIDVFDALVGKKNYSVLEAFIIMKKEFIARALKIDPILFRMFMEYLVRCGIIKNDEMENIDLIII